MQRAKGSVRSGVVSDAGAVSTFSAICQKPVSFSRLGIKACVMQIHHANIIAKAASWHDRYRRETTYVEVNHLRRRDDEFESRAGEEAIARRRRGGRNDSRICSRS